MYFFGFSLEVFSLSLKIQHVGENGITDVHALGGEGEARAVGLDEAVVYVRGESVCVRLCLFSVLLDEGKKINALGKTHPQHHRFGENIVEGDFLVVLLPIACQIAVDNKLKRFSKCIEVTEKCLPIIYSGRKSVWIDNVLLHYIYANYAIEKYDTIVNMFTTPIFNSDRFFWVTAFICILAANKINQINRAQFIIDKFKDDTNINLLLRYINEKNIKILYDVKMLSYIPDIIQKLKHR